MSAANCGIILSGHFSAKILLPYPWVGVGEAVKVRGRGGGCHLAIFVFAPVQKYWWYVLETSCVCYNSHFL